jgi:hypothetical protein
MSCLPVALTSYTSASISSEKVQFPSSQIKSNRASLWSLKAYTIYLAIKSIFVNTYLCMLSLLNSLFLYLWPQGSYDAFYGSLIAIATFSELSSTVEIENPLTISFQVWRPNPRWKRKSPEQPDFHICVLDAREPFPTLAKLEHLYNSIKTPNNIGPITGKIVLAVVDRGVSNFLTLDDRIAVSECETMFS